MAIIQSVGKTGGNRKHDVQYIQAWLNLYRDKNGLPLLKLDGFVGLKTIGTIDRFQHVKIGMPIPDGRVDPQGRTLAMLESQNDAAAQELLVYSALALSIDPRFGQPLLNTRDAVAMIKTMSVAQG